MDMGNMDSIGSREISGTDRGEDPVTMQAGDSNPTNNSQITHNRHLNNSGDNNPSSSLLHTNGVHSHPFNNIKVVAGEVTKAILTHSGGT